MDILVIIIAILAGLAAGVLVVVKLLLGGGDQEERLDLLDRLAEHAVLYAQQYGKEMDGAKRKMMALGTFELLAEYFKLKLPDNWPEIVGPLIEAALKHLKLDNPQTW